MKKIFIILFCAIGVLFSSCSDYLDKDPSTSLPVDASITNLKELQLAVNGIYYIQTGAWYNDDAAYGSPQGVYAGDFTLTADLLGGDFEPKGSYNQISPIARYTVDPSLAITLYFYAKYTKCLALVNSALSQVDKVVVETDADKATYNDLIGQLYALRGLLHFDMARLYCKLPSTVTDMNAASSGLVISDRVFDKSYKSERSTLKETYDFIDQNFETALPLLSKSKHDGYINYWATKGLQARLYLYLEQNDKALTAAKEVIDNSPYKLYTKEEYVDVWSKTYTSESLFELNVNDTYNAQRNSLGFYTHASGYQECGVTTAFLNFMKTRTGDVRTKLIAEETLKETKAYYPQKYPGRGGDIYVDSPKIIRLSEVYLIASEAALKAQGSTSTSALLYLNTLRGNRIDDYQDVKTLNLDDILTERRLELFTEGHNAWDYWRNKRSVNNTTVGVVDYTANKTILPLPQRELSNNPGLVQNPL